MGCKECRQILTRALATVGFRLQLPDKCRSDAQARNLLLGERGDPKEPMKTVKGMIQFAGTTYRIVRVAPQRYEVIRVLDDSLVGLFFLGPRLEVSAGSLPAAELRNIAQMAIRHAKTSWVAILAMT